MSKSKTKIKEEFLSRIELFYRNFGNEWSISDIDQDENHLNVLMPFLKILEDKKIIKLIDTKGNFRIIDLPANHTDLL